MSSSRGTRTASTAAMAGAKSGANANGRGSYVQTLTAVDDIGHRQRPARADPGGAAASATSASLGGASCRRSSTLRQAIAATMAAGDVLVFGPYTFHRSSRANESDRPRRVFINGYAYPGANSRIYPGAGSGRTLRYDGTPIRRAGDLSSRAVLGAGAPEDGAGSASLTWSSWCSPCGRPRCCRGGSALPFSG